MKRAWLAIGAVLLLACAVAGYDARAKYGRYQRSVHSLEYALAQAQQDRREGHAGMWARRITAETALLVERRRDFVLVTGFAGLLLLGAATCLVLARRR